MLVICLQLDVHQADASQILRNPGGWNQREEFAGSLAFLAGVSLLLTFRSDHLLLIPVTLAKTSKTIFC